jgi:antirestriction protein ArdC
MSRSIARARAGRDRTSLYQEITDKIIAELEAGRVPWVQPWGTAAAKASLTMPKNAATHRHYSGLNVLILWGAVIERRFSTQNWLTFRQALGLGAMFARVSMARQLSMLTTLCPMRNVSEPSAMETNPAGSGSSND